MTPHLQRLRRWQCRLDIPLILVITAWPLVYGMTNHSWLVAGAAGAVLCGIVGMKIGLLIAEPTQDETDTAVRAEEEI